MNSDSLAKTSKEACILKRVTLQGYQRKANAMSDAFPEVAMNIIPNDEFSITGVLVDFPDVDMPALQQRETGYQMVDVTKRICEELPGATFTFIAPDASEYNGKQIRQEYLDVCLGGVPIEEREQWLLETIIECGISGEEKDRKFRHA